MICGVRVFFPIFSLYPTLVLTLFLLYSRSIPALFCIDQLIRCIAPGAIDESKICHSHLMNSFQKGENVQMALVAACLVGCQVSNVKAADIVETRFCMLYVYMRVLVISIN